VVTKSDLKADVVLLKEEFTSVLMLKLVFKKGFKENLTLLESKLLKLCKRFKVQK